MTALMAPLNGQFMVKVDHHNRAKQINFSMGPSVKFVLTIIDSISKKKWGLIFFRKIGHEGGVGGSEGFVSVATKFTCSNF